MWTSSVCRDSSARSGGRVAKQRGTDDVAGNYLRSAEPIPRPGLQQRPDGRMWVDTELPAEPLPIGVETLVRLVPVAVGQVRFDQSPLSALSQRIAGDDDHRRVDGLTGPVH